MTTQQHPAQFDWATELLDAEGHVTLSAKEAHEIGARLRSMGDKLKAYEDLDKAASDVQLLRIGYAAARLEIESLQARIKTMAEEHADELMVAHLDGRMRAAQPAGAQQPGAAYAALPGQEVPSYSDDALLMVRASELRAFADATHALRASHGQAPAQAAPAYKDNTPELHIDNSAFESWYSNYSPAHKGDKQRARDAYAAGMGDPLVRQVLRDLPAQQPAPSAAAMSPINRLIAYSAAAALRDLGYEWDEGTEEWKPTPTPQADSQPARDERDDFEKVFPLPSGCIRVGTGYASTGYSNWAAHTHCERWQGWQARAARAPADSVTASSWASHEKELEDALRERDESDEFIDTLLDEVLGADRAEWSSAYGRADALNDVQERMTTLHKPTVDKAWGRFQVAMAADSVLEDAARWQTFIALPYATRAEWASNLSLAPVLTQWVDTARKQGENHD